jgi:histidine triad (HIT) family protein
VSDCIFCEIIDGSIPSPRVYEDDQFICIRDIQPQAKTHLLIVTKEHILSLEELLPAAGKSRVELVGKMFEAAAKIARQQGLTAGYRTVINTGKEGGQTVFHLHMHLLGGPGIRGTFA